MVADRCEPCKGSSARKRGKGWKSGYGKDKRGLNTKIHLAVDAHGMPLRVIITKGTEADCNQAGSLTKDIPAEHLIADKGYDSEEIINDAISNNMIPVIPPRKNRKEQRNYDKHLYKVRHLVENAEILPKVVD